MQFIKQEIQDIILCQPAVFQDERGFFLESYKKTAFSNAGISEEFVQDNHSRSKQGVLRGLHYQIQHPQGKLVRVIVGEIFDAAVDIRKNSLTFGKWVGVHLSAENKNILWVPPGFAHGFYTLSPWAEILYKTTDYYAPEWERTIRWNEPTIGIKWPLIDAQAPILSPKDAEGKLLPQAEYY
jgi:dTDP-4-dehydrorhamnose 3,5-epimerase